jgi:nucleoside-diphosphate-sugar epimerase
VSDSGAAGTVLVTGASGFIGGRLAARLSRDGQSVRCLVRTHSDTSLLDSLEVELVRGELTQPASLQAAAEGCTAVVHCAAIVSDWATVAEIRAANVTGTRNLLEAAWRCGAARFVQISSTDVYGHPGTHLATEEQHPGAFSNWYSQSKLEAERELQRGVDGSGPAIVILRPATVYGPGSVDVIGEIARAIRSRSMILIDRGRADAGLCHVENLLDAIELALTHEAAPGSTFNVSDELGVTWREFTDDLAAGLGCPPVRFSLPYPLAAALGRGMEEGYRLIRRATGLKTPALLSRQAVQVLGVSQSFSAGKLSETLGWTPRVGYGQGLLETLAWLKEAL